MFYILFESRNNETRDGDPLLIWLGDEPGSSPSASIFEDNAPFVIRFN
jgi:hypothetical protein